MHLAYNSAGLEESDRGVIEARQEVHTRDWPQGWWWCRVDRVGSVATRGVGREGGSWEGGRGTLNCDDVGRCCRSGSRGVVYCRHA